MTWFDSEKQKLLKTLHFIMTWSDSEKQKLLKTFHFIMTWLYLIVFIYIYSTIFI